MQSSHQQLKSNSNYVNSEIKIMEAGNQGDNFDYAVRIRSVGPTQLSGFKINEDHESQESGLDHYVQSKMNLIDKVVNNANNNTNHQK